MSVYDKFTGSLAFNTVEVNLAAVPKPNTLFVQLNGLGDLRRANPGIAKVDLMRGEEHHEYDADELVAKLDRMHPATAVKIPHGHGSVGHHTCSACGWVIDSADAYCRRCGARFEGAE